MQASKGNQHRLTELIMQLNKGINMANQIRISVNNNKTYKWAQYQSDYNVGMIMDSLIVRLQNAVNVTNLAIQRIQALPSANSYIVQTSLKSGNAIRMRLESYVNNIQALKNKIENAEIAKQNEKKPNSSQNQPNNGNNQPVLNENTATSYNEQKIVMSQFVDGLKDIWNGITSGIGNWANWVADSGQIKSFINEASQAQQQAHKAVQNVMSKISPLLQQSTHDVSATNDLNTLLSYLTTMEHDFNTFMYNNAWSRYHLMADKIQKEHDESEIRRDKNPKNNESRRNKNTDEEVAPTTVADVLGSNEIKLKESNPYIYDVLIKGVGDLPIDDSYIEPIDLSYREHMSNNFEFIKFFNKIEQAIGKEFNRDLKNALNRATEAYCRKVIPPEAIDTFFAQNKNLMFFPQIDIYR